MGTDELWVVAACFNEESLICQFIESVLQLQLVNRLVLIDDGSRDATLEKLIAAFDLQPSSRPYEHDLETARIRGLYGTQSDSRILVLDKENGGKADAQNAGINVSRAPIFSSAARRPAISSSSAAKGSKGCSRSFASSTMR